MPDMGREKNDMTQPTPAKTYSVRLSATWMEDHLEVWEDDEPATAPKGTYKGKLWIGEIDDYQKDEIISRADYYASFSGNDRRNNLHICKSAELVLKALANLS